LYGAPGRVLGRIKMLECESFGLANAIVIDFVEVHLGGWTVNVVFMRRITRPVTAGGVDLDHHELIGGERRSDDVDDLPRRIASSP
jgi:hypothetical protein